MSARRAAIACSLSLCAAACACPPGERHDRGLVFLPVDEVLQRSLTVEVRVKGGTKVGKGEFPGSYAAEEACTLTLVGPKLALTAAHCFDDRPLKIGVRTPLEVVEGRCTVGPTYAQDKSADWALCRLDSEIGRPWVVINQDEARVPAGTELTLTGYGCVDATGAGSGTYRKGPVRIKRPPGPDQYFVVEGEVSACLGDSGGAAFLAGPRRPVQVSVTSREHPSDPRVSFLASLTTAAARAFLRTPLPGEAAPPDICGVGRPPEACD